MNKVLKVKCPHCFKVFEYYKSEFRPFCCERCKMIDLGHWFEESYRVPLKENVLDEVENENNNSEESLEGDSEEDYK